MKGHENWGELFLFIYSKLSSLRPKNEWRFRNEWHVCSNCRKTRWCRWTTGTRGGRWRFFLKGTLTQAAYSSISYTTLIFQQPGPNGVAVILSPLESQNNALGFCVAPCCMDHGLINMGNWPGARQLFHLNGLSPSSKLIWTHAANRKIL